MSCKFDEIPGLLFVSDNALSIEILKSDAFSVVSLVGYLSKLQVSSGIDFERLIKFISFSPFFIEGEQHQRTKKIFSNMLGKPQINCWQANFEKKIEQVTKEFECTNDSDLVNYCFDIAKNLLRPMLFGFEATLPDDFEIRLYKLQKLVEPLLSIRQLLKLQDELNYLLSCLENCLQNDAESNVDSLFTDLSSETTTNEFSYEDKLMLLLMIYGAKTPLIQTMSNIFLEILVINKEKYFSAGIFDDAYFRKELDKIIHKSAALLHIHRVANKDFRCGDIFIKSGSFVLLDIADQPANSCGAFKSLSFGMGMHYCSGAVISKAIIAMVVPTFFKIYPHATASAWEFDSTIHTAKSLTTLKVKTR
tara:strand:+ start:1255 stop:2343 length:1089 start_codon:yes stop_codon:yes gene_type:complete